MASKKKKAAKAGAGAFATGKAAANNPYVQRLAQEVRQARQVVAQVVVHFRSLVSGAQQVGEKRVDGDHRRRDGDESGNDQQEFSSAFHRPRRA